MFGAASRHGGKVGATSRHCKISAASRRFKIGAVSTHCGNSVLLRGTGHCGEPAVNADFDYNGAVTSARRASLGERSL